MGGLFLLVSGTMETHHAGGARGGRGGGTITFSAVADLLDGLQLDLDHHRGRSRGAPVDMITVW
jgi:hypothetical protein